MQYCAHCGNPVAAVSYAPCPKCGKPSNGAPASPPAAGGSNAPVIIIVLIVGGLAVIAILGILAAIAIPNLLTAQQRAKQKRSMADIRALATAAESYAKDKNEYPKSLDALAPTYIQTVPTDGWGRTFEYECLTDASGTCSGYVIGSPAKDGTFESGGLRQAVSQPRGAAGHFDCDIIYSDGQFVAYPEGVQR